jgi:hypothetical protein
VQQLRGDITAARESTTKANVLASGLAPREASHLAFFGLLIAGQAAAALAALREHLGTWPRDAMVLSTSASANGLIGSSGRVEQKRELLALMDGLASSYGDDWWFTGHHAFALAENGQHRAARAKIDRSMAHNPTNAYGAHTRAHLCYEAGDLASGQEFLRSWLVTYPRDGGFYGHLAGISRCSNSRPATQPRHSGSTVRPWRPRSTETRRSAYWPTRLRFFGDGNWRGNRTIRLAGRRCTRSPARCLRVRGTPMPIGTWPWWRQPPATPTR